MTRKILRTIAFLALNMVALAAVSQTSRLTGKIIDNENGEPVSYATVSVLTQDSSLVTGAITDDGGNFNLAVDPGNYTLKFQFVSYQTKTLKDVDIPAGDTKNLGNINLSVSDKQLEEVVVSAERTQMQLNLDKKVFNVGKDLSNLGGTASDILDNLPSVTVDVEGNVQLRGSSNVQVLIDGKPSGLVGLSSTDALRQLQGNLIETVEIITNPSARYDAEGMSGIINIILKKEKKRGVNGSFQANTGWPHNHGGSFNMNLRRDWVNLFVNYGINYRLAPGNGSGIQEFNLADTSYTSELDRNHERGGFSNNVRFGADFFINDKNTITTSFLYRYSDEQNDTDLSFSDFDINENLINYTLREDLETEGDENLEYSINYTRNFDRKDQKLTADIQYQDNNEIEKSDIVQSEGPNSSELLPELFQKVRNEEGEKRLMIQSDYIHPFNEKGKFEVGFRSTFRDIKNIYNVQEQDDNGEYIPLDTFNTNFAYNEDVHAAYGIISNEYNRFSWQAGLRMEYTDIKANLKESNENLGWEYVNFFPSAFLTYKLNNPENQLQLSYSRRINRPRFRELNPFSSFTDNRNFRVGNPTLQPEFTDSYEFGFLQNIASSTMYYGVYYRYTTDLITRVSLEPNELGQRVSIPQNIGFSSALGIEVNASQEFAEWYRASGNFNFFREETNGMVGDSISLAAEAITFSTRISNNFKIENLFDGQININYRAPQNRPQGRRLSVTSVDLGLTRDILSKNGTISLSVRDLFNSRKWRNITELPTFYEESTWQWRRGPQFIVTFTYRLNQKKRAGRGDGERGDGDFDGGF